MGRIIVLLLLVAAAYLVWRAFGPQSWKRATLFDAPQEPIIKGRAQSRYNRLSPTDTTAAADNNPDDTKPAASDKNSPRPDTSDT